MIILKRKDDLHHLFQLEFKNSTARQKALTLNVLISLVKHMIVRLLFLLLGACIVISCSPSQKNNPEENKYSEQSPDGMVWIPGGEFMMGSTEKESANNALSVHVVKVDGFWMDETEVTNTQFASFVKATGYKTVAERPIDWEQLKKQVPAGTPKPPDDVLQPGSLVFTPPSKPVTLNDYSQWWSWVVGANWQHPQGPGSTIEGKENYPVVHIAYEDAVAYSKWASKRLPTEAENEFAARGGMNGKIFSWGDELNPQGKYMANYFQGAFPVSDTGEDGFKGLSPVKSFPPNGYGLFDIIGNVWELCSDWYSVGQLSKGGEMATNPAGPPSTRDPADPYAIKHVSKGGSYICSDQYCSNYKPSGRQGSAFDSGMSHTGFRCIKTSGQAQ